MSAIFPAVSGNLFDKISVQGIGNATLLVVRICKERIRTSKQMMVDLPSRHRLPVTVSTSTTPFVP